MKIDGGEDKIYRRFTQSKGTKPKRKNEKNRLRNTIMNFRVSPKEKELIEARISATGMEKADFFIIFVRGNIRSFTEIRNRIEELAKTIHRNPRLEEMDPAQAETLKTILEILDRRFEKEETSGGKIV